MTFHKVCTLDDVWEGEMTEVEIGDHEVLLVGVEGGDVRAFQAVCPHQDIPLCEGTRARAATREFRRGLGL